MQWSVMKATGQYFATSLTFSLASTAAILVVQAISSKFKLMHAKMKAELSNYILKAKVF